MIISGVTIGGSDGSMNRGPQKFGTPNSVWISKVLATYENILFRSMIHGTTKANLLLKGPFVLFLNTLANY